MTDLRKWAASATTHDQRELYALAAECRIDSYTLTRWMRGECELDGAQLSRMLVALRRRPVRHKTTTKQDRRRMPVQTELI